MSDRDVIAAHAPRYDEDMTAWLSCVCGGWRMDPEAIDYAGDSDAQADRQHADHVAAALRESRTVRTAEELAALPEGSVYVSDLHPDVPETKARGVWWTAGHDPFEPSLPGRCVYRPDEDGAP